MTATIDETVFNAENIFGKGEANTAFAQYFTGESFLRALVTDPECAVSVHNVTFEPGCRNNWHIHHATSGGGQVLICTAGSGWYQEEGHDAVSLEPGNVIFTRAGTQALARCEGRLLVLPHRPGRARRELLQRVAPARR